MSKPKTLRRVVFLIDGFNLYHSLCDAGKQPGAPCVKWLDLARLCGSYLHAIGDKKLNTQLAGIFYFSALAKHLLAVDPDKTTRHEAFIECLRDTGVEVVLSRFKRKVYKAAMFNCTVEMRRWEEKETDVALAAKMFELLANDKCDVIMLMTGDTDLAPAVKTAQAMYPTKEICLLFPFNRKNKDLARMVKRTWTVAPSKYAKYQLSDPCVLKNKKAVPKPTKW